MSRSFFLLLALSFSALGVKPPLVLLISIDGLRPDYVLQAEKHGLKIPHLRRLVAEGTYAETVTGVTPTLTYPSHTTIVTGVSPDKHGILSNTFFDPEGKHGGGWYWYSEDIKTETLWDATTKARLPSASVDWPVTAGARITYNIPQFFHGSSQTLHDHRLLRLLSTPGLLDEAEKTLGIYPAGYLYTPAADKRRAEFVSYLMLRKRPRLQLAYISSLDEEQHGSGPFSPGALATLEQIDEIIGTLRAAAEKANGGDAVVCVVSDHGFLRTDKEIRINAALRKAGLIDAVDRRKTRSWQAISWSADGSAAIYLKEGSDEGVREKTRQVIDQLAQDSGLISQIIDTRVTPVAGFTGASFVLGAKPGAVFNPDMDPPLFGAKDPAGDHGYLPTVPEMDSAFFLAGKGIRTKNLGRIDMRDIAPTLARLLRVRLPSAQGKALLP